MWFTGTGVYLWKLATTKMKKVIGTILQKKGLKMPILLTGKVKIPCGSIANLSSKKRCKRKS